MAFPTFRWLRNISYRTYWLLNLLALDAERLLPAYNNQRIRLVVKVFSRCTPEIFCSDRVNRGKISPSVLVTKAVEFVEPHLFALGGVGLQRDFVTTGEIFFGLVQLDGINQFFTRAPQFCTNGSGG